MADEKGPDDHVVCVPVADPGWNWVTSIDDLPKQLRAEIGHFFSVYKDLDENRSSEVAGWGTIAEAEKFIAECRRRWQDR
jgi:inorganic pyrophosphatase